MLTFAIPSTVRPTSGRSRLPGFARTGVVLGGLMGAAFMMPALAAVGDRSPYQEFTTQVCRDAGICSANFEVVPANARLEVSSVSCSTFKRPPKDPLRLGLGQGIAKLEFAVLDAAGTIVMHDYAVTRFAGFNDFGVFEAVNHKTFFLVPPGGRVQVVLVWSRVVRGLQLDCKIAGEQVTVR